MAEKRMFAKTIIDSDAFLDMPQSSRLLYFDLGMRADDEGFINNPKKIMRMTGASDDDINILIMKNFIIPFESGVVVIKHWKIHNYIRKDRVNKTTYQDEIALLETDENKAYKLLSDECQSSDGQVAGQISLDKISLDKISLDKISLDYIDNEEQGEKLQKSKKVKHKYGEYKHVLLKDAEKEKLYKEFGTSFTDECIRVLDEAIEMKGYVYKSCYLAIKKWVVDNVKQSGFKQTRQERSHEYEPITREQEETVF